MSMRKDLSDIEKKFLSNSDKATNSNSKDEKVALDSAQRIKEKLSKNTEKEPTVRFTVDLPKSQHKKLKMRAIEFETDMTQLVRELIADYLAQDVE